MKQTAVDWLAENVCHLNISSKEVYKFLLLFEQAKKIEKEQMYDAYEEGHLYFSPHENFNEYYNETYK
jgi:hypothetical protein